MNLSSFGLKAKDYVDFIKWENATELPLIQRLSDDMFSKAKVNSAIIPVAITTYSPAIFVRHSSCKKKYTKSHWSIFLQFANYMKERVLYEIGYNHGT